MKKKMNRRDLYESPGLSRKFGGVSISDSNKENNQNKKRQLHRSQSTFCRKDLESISPKQILMDVKDSNKKDKKKKGKKKFDATPVLKGKNILFNDENNNEATASDSPSTLLCDNFLDLSFNNSKENQMTPININKKQTRKVKIIPHNITPPEGNNSSEDESTEEVGVSPLKSPTAPKSPPCKRQRAQSTMPIPEFSSPIKIDLNSDNASPILNDDRPTQDFVQSTPIPKKINLQPKFHSLANFNLELEKKPILPFKKSEKNASNIIDASTVTFFKFFFFFLKNLFFFLCDINSDVLSMQW